MCLKAKYIQHTINTLNMFDQTWKNKTCNYMNKFLQDNNIYT